MSLDDYLYRALPGPYRLSARITRPTGSFLFRVDIAHEALAVAAVRERHRVREANEMLLGDTNG